MDDKFLCSSDWPRGNTYTEWEIQSGMHRNYTYSSPFDDVFVVFPAHSCSFMAHKSWAKPYGDVKKGKMRTTKIVVQLPGVFVGTTRGAGSRKVICICSLCISAR